MHVVEQEAHHVVIVGDDEHHVGGVVAAEPVQGVWATRGWRVAGLRGEVCGRRDVAWAAATTGGVCIAGPLGWGSFSVAPGPVCAVTLQASFPYVECGCGGLSSKLTSALDRNAHRGG